MQIRQLKVSNFRGIGSLDWKPASPFCCLIGAGDSGKSSILDAAEACLSSRWFVFSEPDFTGADTAKAITIEVTVGELSGQLKSDERFGLYIRGWTKSGELRDEPEGDDEPVLTVRLTVDASMEPLWELVCERTTDARLLSNRDRALFGLIRLAGDDARQLAWGQGSILSRLTGDSEEAAGRLAEAYRAARQTANLGQIEALTKAAGAAEEFAKGFGAYVEVGYGPGLELGRSGLTSGSIALHDGSVPLRLAGLGTRRLATLGLQKSAIAEGAIVLVDEIEHGLEPHRVLGAISQLKAGMHAAKTAGKPLGQVLMTTHSDVTLGEVGPDALRSVVAQRPTRKIEVARSQQLGAMLKLIRFTPRALFARRIMVCEGYTEVGLLMGMRELWPGDHNGLPIEHRGAAIVDGNGTETCNMALNLAKMGFTVAIYRDSDDAIGAAQIEALNAAGIPVFEYGGGIYTERAIFEAAEDAQVQRILEYAREQRGEGFINDNLVAKIPGLDAVTVREQFELWEILAGVDLANVRAALSEVSSGKAFETREERKSKNWFKDQVRARGLGPIVHDIAATNPGSPLAQTLKRVEAWLYG
jgi:hypothetical protein